MCFRPPEINIKKTCTDCGLENPFEAQKCMKCGAELPSEVSGMPAGVPGAPPMPGAPSAPGAPAMPPVPKAPGA